MFLQRRGTPVGQAPRSMRTCGVEGPCPGDLSCVVCEDRSYSTGSPLSPSSPALQEQVSFSWDFTPSRDKWGLCGQQVQPSFPKLLSPECLVCSGQVAASPCVSCSWSLQPLFLAPLKAVTRASRAWPAQACLPLLPLPSAWNYGWDWVTARSTRSPDLSLHSASCLHACAGYSTALCTAILSLGAWLLQK